jgi:CheY-like chemotaxis protein
MDVGLPDFSGYEITEKIRLLEVNSKWRALIAGLSGHVAEDQVQQSADAGMDRMLLKPLTEAITHELLANVSALQNS